MPKKILFCATVDFHFKAFHLPYMRWFQEQGWEVHVAASGNMELPYVDARFDVPIQRSPLKLKNIKAYYQLKSIMDENQYEIIHCHTPMGGVLARLAARSARKRGAKVIYTAHGFHFCKGAPLMNWLLYYPIERGLSRFTDCLITINEEDYNLAKDHHFKARKIVQVNGVGVNEERFKPVTESEKHEMRLSLGYHPDAFLLFYAAEFNANKNQQSLIRIMDLIKNEVPQARLLLAGKGALKEPCLKLARELGLEDKVDFLGYRNDLDQLLPICDLAVASSIREGLPVNIMEAMASGLPVVATNNRGHRELVRSNENGWVVNRDLHSEVVMAEMIKVLAKDKDLASRFGKTGRKLIEGRYAINKILHEKNLIYSEFMNEECQLGAPVRILHAVVNMNRGGAETLLMNLYRNIDRTKVQFDFLTCKAGTFDEEIEALGGRIHRIPYVTDVGHSAYIKSLNRFFRSHPEYKIIHSHMDKMSGFILRAAKKAGIPTRIAHSHNTSSEGGMAAKLYKWVAGKFVKPCATHFLACSNRAANWLFAEKEKQAIILKNGIESDKFSFSTDVRRQVRQEMQLAEESIVIGHVGRFCHQKNHSYLLEIFSQLNREMPNTVLVLAGDGPLRSEIEKKTRELNLTDKVRFLGVRSDVNQLLQGLDLFVFPSWHEGLPVTLIEAQGAGLPCIVSDVITREVDLGMNRVDFLPLGETKIWVEKMKQVIASDLSREIPVSSLSSKGYDIKNTAVWTEGFYTALSR